MKLLLFLHYYNCWISQAPSSPLMPWGHKQKLLKRLSRRKGITFGRSRQIIPLSTIRFKNSLKKPLHSNFKALMSVMKNVLKKDITVGKSVKSGRFQLRLLIIFIHPDYGQDFKVLSWLYESVISGTKLPVRFSFICLLYTVMLNLLVGLFDNIGVLKTRLIGLLTVHLRSDACRIRSFHSPRNFALLRRIALNALNRELTYKRSLRQKMKRTAMDNDYMIQVLFSCFLDPTLDSSESLCQA